MKPRELNVGFFVSARFFKSAFAATHIQFNALRKSGGLSVFTYQSDLFRLLPDE